MENSTTAWLGINARVMRVEGGVVGVFGGLLHVESVGQTYSAYDVRFLEAESVRVWREQYPTQTLSSLQEDILTVLNVADIDRQLLRAQKKLDERKAQEASKLLGRLIAAAQATPEQCAHQCGVFLGKRKVEW